MYLKTVTIAVLCFTASLNFGYGSFHTDDGLELLFRQRSHSDWVDVWHEETHSRCRNKLLRHLYWACEKDIYQLTRRAEPTIAPALIQKDEDKRYLDDSKWLLRSLANSFLRIRRKSRTSGQSITNECCTKVGCTWEEYAEYCPANKRRNHFH